MKQFLILMMLLFSFGNSFSQETDIYRIKKNLGKVTLTPYSNSEITLLRVSGFFNNARKIIYHDTINGFQAIVPKSLEMQETNNLNNFCMTVPRKNGRDNAICINSVPKSDYETLEKFEYHIIGNPKYFGSNSEKWLWGNNSNLISVNQEKFDSYESYKVSIQVNNRKVLGQFIIIETKKSFLWINYVADVDTFESDLKQFSKFLKRFELLN